MKKVLSLIIAGIVATAANAEEYKFEVGGDYGQFKNDKSNAKVDSYSANGKFFFEGLDASKGPRKEAEFLSKASNIRMSFHKISPETDVLKDLNKYSLGATYHFRAPFFAELDITYMKNTDLGIGQVLDDKVEVNSRSYRLGGGYYINKDWSVYGDVTQIDHQLRNVKGSIEDQTNWTIGTKIVKPTAANQWIAVKSEYTSLDLDGKDAHDNSLLVAADYFFNRDLSVGASLKGLGKNVFSTEDKIMSLNASYYVVPQVALTASYTKTSMENDAADSDGFGLGVRARF